MTRFSLDECIAYVAGKIREFQIEEDVMEMVRASRKYYDSFKNLVLGHIHDKYQKFIAGLPFTKGCIGFSHRFRQIFKDSQCFEHHQRGTRWNANRFLLHLANSHNDTKKRVEAYIACHIALAESESESESDDDDDDYVER